jgi:hypothetical protein
MAMSGITVTPGQTSPHLMQVAFIVDDVEAAAKAWIATTGIGPFYMVPHIELTEMTYRGEPARGLRFFGGAGAIGRDAGGTDPAALRPAQRLS